MREIFLQKQIVLWLQMQERIGKLVFIRNNSFSGHITRKNGSKGFIKNSKKGSADILIFINSGITLHVELKTETGRQSKEQKEYASKIESLGHRYIVIRSLIELRELIEEYY